MANKSSEEDSSIGSKSNNSHSRQGSDICQTSSSGFSDIRQTDIGNCVQGSIVGLHRKMVSKVKLHILWIGKPFIHLLASEFLFCYYFRYHKKHIFYRLRNIVLFCLDCQSWYHVQTQLLIKNCINRCGSRFVGLYHLYHLKIKPKIMQLTGKLLLCL